jgi:Ca-activated chloride channel homolog
MFLPTRRTNACRARSFDRLTMLSFMAGLFAATLLALSTPANAQTALEPSRAATQVVPPSAIYLSPNEATNGTLLFRAIEENKYIQAPLQASDIKIDVTGLTARTKVTQSFYNPTDSWIEGIYVFPLPEEAGVDSLKMQIGDRFIEGQIKERQEARRIYEQAKAEGKKTALLEQQRPNLFTNSIANIGPHEMIVVQIEYQQALSIENDEVRLRFPMVVAPRFSPPAEVQMVVVGRDGYRVGQDLVKDREDISAPILDPQKTARGVMVNPVTLTVDLKPGFELAGIESPFHEILQIKGDDGFVLTLKEEATPANRDFELIWKAKAGKAPSAALFKETFNGEDYIYALLSPPLQNMTLEAKPREVIFVIDNSGSMGGTSIRQAKESLIFALDRLAPTDRFNVIRFDDTMETLFKAPVHADLENTNFAKRFVGRLDAEGGTMMLPALKAALFDPDVNDPNFLRQVIFLTDGAIGNEAELFVEIGRNLGRSRLFTVGIGSAPNSHFMNRAASIGRGAFTYIGDLSQVAERMNALFIKLEAPVLVDLKAEFTSPNISEAWPNPLPDLYSGEPILITAKMPKADGKLIIDGMLGGDRWAIGLDLKDAADGQGIAKLWARRKISSLEQSRFDGAEFQDIEDSVLKTALDYSLVSRLTSLVAVDVTPSRPEGEGLGTAKIPLNLPEGWNFETVFGPKGTPVPTLHTRAGDRAVQYASLAIQSKVAPSSMPLQAKGMNLPQGATRKGLERIIGLILMMAGLAVFATKREAMKVRVQK